MTPILIVIPYWAQDRDMAYELCRLITHMQPHHMGNTAHILLANRQDCFPDQSMLQLCNQKFTTFQFHSQSPLRGWPDGANGMFGSSMIHIATTSSHLYETVFWMEPDCVPMRPNWFWDLVLAWRSKVPQAIIVGTDVSVDGSQQARHINGCALYHPNIARIMPSICSCSGQAWDWLLREPIIQVSQNTDLIRLMYNSRNADPVILTQDHVVITHGFKDSSLLKLVGQKYGLS